MLTSRGAPVCCESRTSSAGTRAAALPFTESTGCSAASSQAAATSQARNAHGPLHSPRR